MVRMRHMYPAFKDWWYKIGLYTGITPLSRVNPRKERRDKIQVSIFMLLRRVALSSIFGTA